MKLLNSLVIALVFITGCANKPVEVVKQTYSDKEKEIAESMEGMSKKDCIILYKQLSGLTEYLKNTNVVITTLDINAKIIPSFQKDYNYEKNPKTTEAIKKYLDSLPYMKESKKIVESVTDDKKEIAESEFIEDITILVNAAKCAIESKE